MIPISEALKIIKRETLALSPETIDLENSVGRVLAQEIRADMDLPPFDRSQMDGFAVKTFDVARAPVQLKIVGESIAGKGFDGKLNPGEAVRIMTGARVPNGADAVQKVELTEEENGFITITEKTKVRENINAFASEIETGKQIFETGEIITENMIAAIASFGYAKVKVFKKPKAAILSTGSEIVDISVTPQKDQIRNSNSVMLKVFADRFADVEILPSVKDNIKSLRTAIEKAAKNFDFLITTGGVSVGDYDFTKPVLRELGAEIFFEKISLKPGKPTVFAKLKNCLIFALPGNPVSSVVTFYLFARTALLKMQSAKSCELKPGFAVVSDNIKAAKERDSFLPASLETDKKGKLIIESLRFNGSSNFIAFARADALVFVPQGKNLESGDIAEILFLQ
ncbi:MAG: molybdopterin molybdotransferase MoeA [Acidobacteria bacterium]|nr:molybdopterin molybdotransferase MoeA [Acidobacteriota bacterium]MBA3784715.1 molybdopterin molybdotransferase MoeA [Acidobacteriota bacterium]MBA4184229.1 molybdopterin molybdotransferase MoeA [Acidobacteriota bacterium]